MGWTGYVTERHQGCVCYPPHLFFHLVARQTHTTIFRYNYIYKADVCVCAGRVKGWGGSNRHDIQFDMNDNNP